MPKASLGELVVAVQVEEQGVFIADQVVELEMVVVKLRLRYSLKTQLLLARRNRSKVSLALFLMKEEGKGLNAHFTGHCLLLRGRYFGSGLQQIRTLLVFDIVLVKKDGALWILGY